MERYHYSISSMTWIFLRGTHMQIDVSTDRYYEVELRQAEGMTDQMVLESEILLVLASNNYCSGKY
jgi:hypothetical protein